MDFIQPNKRMINWGAILSGICLIAICFSIALCSLNDSSQTEGQITAMRYQENAVAANELLTQAFERDSNGAIIFPEDYAGAYIDGENLVLLLTNTDSKTVEKYRTWTDEYAPFLVFKKAEYSYNQLRAQLQPIVQHLTLSGYTVTSYSVSETVNAVLIGLSECTDAESIKLEDNLCKMFGIRVVISEQAHTIELTEECTSTEFH